MRKVMYKDSNGSFGTATEPQSNGRVYVTWCYGKAADGEYITSTQGYSIEDAKKNLIDVPEDIYQAYINEKAWSAEQQIIAQRITGPAFDATKYCRGCKHWGADPDDEYCGHPDALKTSSIGINLKRARGDFAFKPDHPSQDPAFGVCGPKGDLWEKK